MRGGNRVHLTDEQYLAKFKARTETNDSGCWLYVLGKDSFGYGQVYVHGVRWKLHRWMFSYHKEEIPRELFVCHTCDIPACCNPEHLWLGTKSDNERDKVAKGRFGNQWTRLRDGTVQK